MKLVMSWAVALFLLGAGRVCAQDTEGTTVDGLPAGNEEILWAEMTSPSAPNASAALTQSQLQMIQYIMTVDCDSLKFLVIYLIATAEPVECPPCPECPKGIPGYAYTYCSTDGYIPVSPGYGRFYCDTPGHVTFYSYPNGNVAAAKRWIAAFKRGDKKISTSLTQAQQDLIKILLQMDCQTIRYLCVYVLVNPPPPPECPPCPECPTAIAGYTYTYSTDSGFVPVAVGSGSYSCTEPGVVQFQYDPTESPLPLRGAKKAAPVKEAKKPSVRKK